MLKSRLLAGGILTLAVACAIPVGLVAHPGFLAGSTETPSQNMSDQAVFQSASPEYAVTLSGGRVLAEGVKLEFATQTDAVTLPKVNSDFSDETSASISILDPTIQEEFSTQEAENNALVEIVLPETSITYDDGFVFDINNTIFPVTEEEVEMLKYVVEAEAGGGSMHAKRIVTFSITNRILCDSFPDTLYEVLHARNQFSTIQNYYNKRKVPSEDTCRAVEEVLMGACEDVSQNCMYFYCTEYPIDQWIIDWFEEDLVYLYTVGCDRFFTDPS